MNCCSQYPRPITEEYSKELKQLEENTTKTNPGPVVPEETVSEDRVNDQNVDAQMDSPEVPMRFNEKKRLHWKGLTCM